MTTQVCCLRPRVWAITTGYEYLPLPLLQGVTRETERIPSRRHPGPPSALRTLYKKGNREMSHPETALRWKQNDGARQPDGVRWTVADLDRCEHGRHSIDSCFDCPNGRSSGNLYLQTPLRYQENWTTFGDLDRARVRGHADGRIEVRIGTMVRGEPIWVTTHDTPRS